MSNLIAFIILFGILVFVHELGHFLMAKYFKIGVEKFALGFGPKVFGKKVGETEYMICALPLGGFVKMVGDEPIDEKDAEAGNTKIPENGFLAKHPLKRIGVVLMGPIANLILPIVLYMVVYLVGQPYLSTQVGHVVPDSVAANAGLLPGDEITAIDGEVVLKWTKMTKKIEDLGKTPTVLSVKRGTKELEVKVTPVIADGLSPFGEVIPVGRIGISPESFLATIYVPGEETPAYKAGLRTGDEIVAVQGESIDYFSEFETAIASTANKTLELTVKRDGKKLSHQLDFGLFYSENTRVVLANLGLFPQSMVIDKVLPDTIASEKGLQSKDVLYAINDNVLSDWFGFQETIQNNKGEALNLMLIRAGEFINVDLTPRMEEEEQELTGEKTKRRMLGVSSMGRLRTSNIKTERILNPIKSFRESFERCFFIAKLTVVGFGKLITGQVSTKSLGGPILIYQLAGRSWKSGIFSFINMLVLISITLGILNLLPIPVLDGGHLMFYTVELITGRPVKTKTRQMAQQVGVILLVGLMVFAFYNDLGRISWDEVGWVKWIKGMFS